MSAAGDVPIVGFVGLGNQGSPIAARIVGGGLPLRVWARREASLAEVASTAAVVMPSLTTLAAACDIVCVCVLADADVLQVCTGEDGLLPSMRSGTVLLVHSTVAAQTCEAVAEAANSYGVHVLDAPVSGGEHRARKGEMSVMVGGDRSVFERCRGVFETFANSIEYLGPLGSGQRAKLVNNAVFTVNLSIANAAIDIGVALGIDREALTRVLIGSSANSFALQTSAGASVAGRHRAAMLLRKDVDHFSAMTPPEPSGGFADRSARDAIAWLESQQEP